MNSSISNFEKNKPVIAVVGPTASGKSNLAIALALEFGGEIINCDSVQIYREIEIATAKVPLNERRGVPHHLLDYVDPRINYSAAQWAADAAARIVEIEARGNLALLAGGTGFYLRSLREPLFESPPTNYCLRGRLERLKDKYGVAHLHKMLQRFDAASAARLEPRDYPRIGRALEIYFQTGQTMSAQMSNRAPAPEFAARMHIFCLNPPRAELYARINARAEKHFADGLVAEVEDLLERGVPSESNALGAHGYRRVVEYLRGARTLESAIEQTKLDVRHYAKRQLTWFRRETGVEWINGFGDDPRAQAEVINKFKN